MLVELLISSNCDNNDIVTQVKLNNAIVTNLTCSVNNQRVSIDVDDDTETTQIVSIEMSGKTEKHTSIDNNGNILHDTVVKLDQVVIDDVDVTNVFCQGKQCYVHDFNGTQDKITDEFYGVIGCNGVVSIEFTTPVFVWLLDNT